MLQQREGTFRAAGGLELYYRAWQGQDAPQAALVIVHGMGDHSGRFDRLVGPLARMGFAAYAFDLRGFGRSPGRRGHIAAWGEYLDDVSAFLEFVRGQLPGVPLFLFGYSLGAAIVLDFVQQRPGGLRGAVLSGAPIEPVGVATPAQIRMARLMSRIWPTFSIANAGDFNNVTRDTEVLDALRGDPLHVGAVTARWGAEALAAMERVRAGAARVSLPVLFVHGGADPINLPGGVQEYLRQVASTDKTLILYPGSRHETHNDLDHAQVAADVARWIAERI